MPATIDHCNAIHPSDLHQKNLKTKMCSIGGGASAVVIPRVQWHCRPCCIAIVYLAAFCQKKIKQSTGSSVFGGGILTPHVQWPGTSKITMPPSMLQQKKEKQLTCSIGGCGTVYSRTLTHMEREKQSTCA